MFNVSIKLNFYWYLEAQFTEIKSINTQTIDNKRPLILYLSNLFLFESFLYK